MKLHLPKSLLCALLSCLASMTYSNAASFDSNQIFDTSTSLTEESIINGNLTFDIKEGVIVTQETGGFHIGNHNFTLTGGGTLVVGTTSTVQVGSGQGSIPTLTITNNSTLDISQGTLNNGTYTRLNVNVNNGGVLRVKEYNYGSMNSIANNANYWVFNGGIIELTASSIATNEGTRNASFSTGLTANGLGAHIKNDTTEGIVQLAWGGNNYMQVNGKVTFDGAGSYATAFESGAVGIKGAGTIVKPVRAL